MKRILTLVAMMAVLLSCGGNNQKKTSDGAEKGKKEASAKKSKLSIGDKFAFAGLESDALVPSFAKEISELQVDPRSESNPIKDAVYFYTGPDITAIPPAKVQEYLQQAFAAVKKAADGGHIYKINGVFKNERKGEITEPPTTDRHAGSFDGVYQHDGKWYYISVGHKAFFHKFVKEYPDKFIGVGILVQEILGDVVEVE